MKDYPPNFFENKDFLNQKLILEIKNSHDTLVPIIAHFDNAIANSRIIITANEHNEEKTNQYHEFLKENKRQCIKIINEIEKALDNFQRKKDIGYIQQAKDLYRFLKNINTPLIRSQFKKVSKISQQIIKTANDNLERLKEIK